MELRLYIGVIVFPVFRPNPINRNNGNKKADSLIREYIRMIFIL